VFLKKEENTFLASLWQFGQEAISSDLLKERISSNLDLQ